MTKALTFDQAGVSGWAFGTESSARYEFGSFKAPKAMEEADRIGYLIQNADSLIRRFDPDVMAIEEAFFPHQGSKLRMNLTTAKFLQRVQGAFMGLASIRGVPLEMYTPATWRKTLLGYGMRPKKSAVLAEGDKPRIGNDDHMKRAVRAHLRMLGYDVRSFDEADAMGLLVHCLNGAPAMLRRQGDLLAMATKNL